MARAGKNGHGFRWRKDWPWVALAGIAVAVFFLHAKTPPPAAPASKVLSRRGRGRYANQNAGLVNDGGNVG